MMNYKIILVGGTGQYKLVLLSIRWCRVSIGLLRLYLLKKVEIGLGVTDP